MSNPIPPPARSPHPLPLHLLDTTPSSLLSSPLPRLELASDSEDSDNVPLAQRIPTALTAQKSIRIKHSSHRRAKDPVNDVPQGRQTHPRAPQNTSPLATPVLPPDELTRKLLNLQVRSPRPDKLDSCNKSTRLDHPDVALRALTAPLKPHEKMWEPLSSTGDDESYGTDRRAPRRLRTVAAHAHAERLDFANAEDRGKRFRYREDVLGRSAKLAARHDRPTDSSVPRSSSDAPRSGQETVSFPVEATMPRMSPDTLSEPTTPSKDQLWARRATQATSEDLIRSCDVHVVDLQRVISFDVFRSTTAKSALDALVKQRGLISDVTRIADLSLWELANDFGMERPIRESEYLRDILASWDIQKPVNAFMVKYSPLAQLMNRKAIPTDPPELDGEVMWEAKRGKWSKRYLTLRDGSLYLGKSSKTKDETFLCSLSNHDAYLVTRMHKAPKPFVFCIKSCDNIAFFENPAEYLHVFCVTKAEGERWRDHILLARSHILLRDRIPPSLPAIPATQAMRQRAMSLSRSATKVRKPLSSGSAHPFQEGTLLANIAG